MAVLAIATASAQTISFVEVPPGYEAGSIDLGDGFTGALAADPANPDIIYASVGYYQHNYVVKVDLSDSSVTTVASGWFGSIGGLAIPAPHQLIIVDNDDYTTNAIPGETFLICTDKNTDGDFDDPGEIEELISPILVDWTSFTGAQARIAPSGDPSNIPSGSLLFQNADGGTKADLFVVTDPTSNTTAAYRPSGAAYFTGFDYNGGFDSDSAGRIFMGAGNSSWTGEVFALVNTNGDEDIDAGESNDVVTSTSLPGSITDIIIDKEDDVFVVTNPWGGYQIQTFDIPADPLTQHATLTDFAKTDAGWMSAVIINSKSLPFEPNLLGGGATMLMGGMTATYASATNLLTLTPHDITRIGDWELY